MEASLKILIDKVNSYNPSADTELIEKAFNYAANAHEGQIRASGEPFVMHPIEVALIISDMGLDVDSIVASLLHDTVEDTLATVEEISRNFGSDVANLVDGVTKLSQIHYSSKEEQQIENLRKMFLAMAKDIRVILIKLADRLHNMRTILSLPEVKQREKARETLEVYAPIAHRLGMSKVKWELEDLSLRYIDPIGYYEIVDKISQKRQEREEYINEIIEILEDKLEELSIKSHLEGRAKHFYSIYRKMFTQHKSLEEIYDLFAVRVIVDTVADCYAVLGMVHELFKPIPGRFKDYIAVPKTNMYQSLHSTLIGKNGTPFEIQIRTWQMHNTAENGIASHWKYKEGLKGEDSLDGKLEWIKKLIEIQKEVTDSQEFMHTLKIDLFGDEVFVFTPKGDVINLPSKSCIVDFAYAIHSAVGNRMIGAKVNGRIVTLDYTLQNGNIVEILTSPSIHGPSRDWLKIAKTSQARNKINQWFKKENREDNIIKGKEYIEKELKKNNIPLKCMGDKELVDPLLKKYSFHSLDDLYATLGYGGTNATKFVTRLKDDYKKFNQAESLELPQELFIKTSSERANKSGVIVKGIENCLIRFSHCCNPVPGDDIIGYVTRGRGVAIHRRDCINIVNPNFSEKEMERFIDVDWSEKPETHYQSLICLTASDRVGLMADVTAVTKDLDVPIRGMNARMAKGDLAIIDIVLSIGNAEQLQKTIKTLRNIEGVMSVTRKRQ